MERHKWECAHLCVSFHMLVFSKCFGDGKLIITFRTSKFGEVT